MPDYRLVHSGSAKNAADILIAPDAVDLRLSGKIDTFLIASSDGDFTHLATRLREYETKAVGIGQVKAPAVYRAACSAFLEMKPLAPASVPQRIQRPPRHSLRSCLQHQN